VGAANGDRHAADLHRQRIAPERAGVERLDHHVRIEAELAQAAASWVPSSAQSIAAIRPRSAKLKLVKREGEIGRGWLHGHCCD
jgi:hypothetical protein